MPVAILLPGLLFLVAGVHNLRRALAVGDGSDLDRHLRLARRRTAIVTMCFGILLLAIGIPLIVAIMQLGS